jgi:hypothetical protein
MLPEQRIDFASPRLGRAPGRAGAALGLFATLFAVLLATPSRAAETPEGVRVTGARVRLLDVLPSCPESSCSADLGPAPAAGTSRVVERSAIRAALEATGQNPEQFPGLLAVRVTSVARSWTPAQLGAWLRPSIERQLPPGVRLLSVESKTVVVLPLLASVGECTLGPLPRRSGAQAINVAVDFVNDGSFVRRVPVLVRLALSEQAARPKVPRGAVLTLVIERPMATVSAHGIALKDGDVGQTVPFKVQPTGRIVQARIQSETLAVVVEGS